MSPLPFPFLDFGERVPDSGVRIVGAAAWPPELGFRLLHRVTGTADSPDAGPLLDETSSRPVEEGGADCGRSAAIANEIRLIICVSYSSK